MKSVPEATTRAAGTREIQPLAWPWRQRSDQRDLHPRRELSQGGGSGDRAVRPARCDAPGGNAAALDWNLRTAGSEWFLLGQATASRAEGGPPLRTLADGTELARGDAGYGGHAALGRIGGDPWRFELHGEYQSTKLAPSTMTSSTKAPTAT